jgi:hypothetical protein
MSASDIFDTPTRWATYRGELLVHTLVGGIPKDPDTIRAWLKARMELGDTEIMAVVEETLEAMGADQPTTSDQLDDLVDEVMAKTAPKGNSFKTRDGELQWEGRCLKAAIREASNVMWPGITDWPGKPKDTRKGLANYLKDRVEVADTYIPLGRTAPDITGEQRIKHVTGPQGMRSAINVVDVCENVKIAFTIRVLDDCIPQQVWGAIWSYIELGGVGADRARGDGRCELLAWERTD